MCFRNFENTVWDGTKCCFRNFRNSFYNDCLIYLLKTVTKCCFRNFRNTFIKVVSDFSQRRSKNTASELSETIFLYKLRLFQISPKNGHKVLSVASKISETSKKYSVYALSRVKTIKLSHWCQETVLNSVIAWVIATAFAGNLDFVRSSERPYIKTDSVTWLRGSGA